MVWHNSIVQNNPILKYHNFIQSNRELNILGAQNRLDETESRMQNSELLADICKSDTILEIGPAEGLMDYVLKDRCKSITAIEASHEFYKICLEFQKLYNYSNVNYILGNAFDINSLISNNLKFDKILFYNVHLTFLYGVDTIENDVIQLYQDLFSLLLEHLAPNGILYFTNKYFNQLTPIIMNQYKDIYSLNLVEESKSKLKNFIPCLKIINNKIG